MKVMFLSWHWRSFFQCSQLVNSPQQFSSCKIMFVCVKQSNVSLYNKLFLLITFQILSYKIKALEAIPVTCPILSHQVKFVSARNMNEFSTMISWRCQNFFLLWKAAFQLFIGRKKMTKEKAAVEANLIGGKKWKTINWNVVIRKSSRVLCLPIYGGPSQG